MTRITKDGNANCITFDGFTNLQASPALFCDGEQVVPETLPEYQVAFVIYEESAVKYAPIIECKESLDNGTVACLSVRSRFVDFSDFERKGSVGVNGYFIHDDDRADGDCIVFQLGGTQ